MLDSYLNNDDLERDYQNMRDNIFGENNIYDIFVDWIGTQNERSNRR